jgi:hypothetical protein
MFKILSLFAFIVVSNNSYAISATTASKTSNGIALERIQAYASSSTKAKTVGIIEPGTELIEFKTFMKTNPGLAMMEETSLDSAIPFDRGAHIYIWEYLGNGYSKVKINGISYNAKIARSKSECDEALVSRKYCWAKVVQEPEYYEWKQVALTQDGQKFWFLNRIIDGSGIIVVKDQGIEKARITQTKYVEQPKKAEEVVEIKQNNSLLIDPDLKKDANEVESLEEKTAKLLLLSPEEREKARLEAKQKVKEMNNPTLEVNYKASEVSQEDMFKQQSIKDLEAKIGDKSTQNTLNIINKDLDRPAKKLELKANTPLDLTVNEPEEQATAKVTADAEETLTTENLEGK